MQNKDNDFNTIKNILKLITAVVLFGVVLKKLYKWIKKYDDDSFKWDETVGDDIEELIHKYQKEAKVEGVTGALATAATDLVVHVTEASKPKPRSKPKKITPAAEVIKNETVFDLNERQEEIYEMIRSGGELTMSDITDSISAVSTRTLRRDMNKLEKLGLIARSGKTKDSVYKLKS